MNFFEQLAGGILFLLGIAYAIIAFFHTLTFPLSEDKMRKIIREEIKKILVEAEQ